MHFSTVFTLAAATLSSLVSSTPIDYEKRAAASPLKVSLAEAGNAQVTVTLTNTGSSDLSLLKYGTIFEAGPVQKVVILKDGTVLPHEGISRTYLMRDFPSTAFSTLTAGQTVSDTIDLASIADLSAGGTYEVATAGSVPLAHVGSTELNGESVYFESNTLSIEVDGAKASAVSKAVDLARLAKRTQVQAGCSSAQSTALRNALSQAVTLANNAATAATSGSASKFNEYFKTTATATRSTVAARLRGVATQAGSTTSGATKYYCTDVYGDCGSNVLAYTLPSANTIANCPLYYSGLPSLTRTCHAQDQTTTSIHEFTHAPGTYSPGTQDNAYGYSASTALTSARAVLNADTYALYSNGELLSTLLLFGEHCIDQLHHSHLRRMLDAQIKWFGGV